MTSRLYLMRHGETAWSLSGQHTGRADIPLTKKGEVEARQLGKRIRSIAFTQVFCSPLTRARQTCESAGLSQPPLIDDDLAEWDNGDYEGKTHAEILDLAPNWNLFCDGCPNGETPSDIGARADRLVARFSKIDGNIAVFAHSHLGRVLAVRWIGLAVESAEHFLLDTASVSILSHDLGGGKPRSIRLWNSTPLNSMSSLLDQDCQTAASLKQRALERWENEGGEALSPPMSGSVDTPSK